MSGLRQLAATALSNAEDGDGTSTDDGTAGAGGGAALPATDAGALISLAGLTAVTSGLMLRRTRK